MPAVYAEPDGGRDDAATDGMTETPADYIRRLRALRRAQGLCIQCGREPSVSGGRCVRHAEEQRRRTRLWMRKAHGSKPQYLYQRASAPVRYATDSSAEGWEQQADGRWQRIWVDWRDPLLILLTKEARGWFQFMRPSPLVVPRGLAF